MDHGTEFESNVTLDRFALYLRPLNENGAPLNVPGATESQERWGGLHATLCGFAPKQGARGAKVKHPSSLIDTLDRAHSAAGAAAAQSGAGEWRLSRDAILPAEHNALMLLPTSTGDSPTLRAIAEVVTSAGLLNARPAESLHISIGSADAARAQAVRAALMDAPRWELVIAKCHAGTERLKVTEFRESKELAW